MDKTFWKHKFVPTAMGVVGGLTLAFLVCASIPGPEGTSYLHRTFQHDDEPPETISLICTK